MLDIVCGTGRILLPCLQAGVDTEGLDLFEPMLKTLQAKAATLSLSPKLHQADMCDFSLLLRVAGFARWDIFGDFDRAPLTRENDAMVVEAWNGEVIVN